MRRVDINDGRALCSSPADSHGDAAESLRQGMLAAMQLDPSCDPDVWAAFVLLGERYVPRLQRAAEAVEEAAPEASPAAYVHDGDAEMPRGRRQGGGAAPRDSRSTGRRWGCQWAGRSSCKS